MSFRRFINQLFSRGAGHQPGVPQDIVPPLVEWPLPEALPIGPLKPVAQCVERPNVRQSGQTGMEVFAYPFESLEIAELVQASWWSSPDAGDMPDRKYCEFTIRAGSTHYVGCRTLIDALQRLEGRAGKGVARLRLIALDRFGYTDEARSLFHQFEREMGPSMAAMGFARILLGHNHPERALEVVESARRRGAAGAALEACQARMLFACGRPSDGVRLASEAIRSPPDPLWMPADHFYTWGLLHGAALASRGDSSFRQDVLRAVDAIGEAEDSAGRALACASLAEYAGDLSVAMRFANDALERAKEDSEVLAEAEWALQRARDVADLRERLNLPSTSIDTRRAALNINGWSLDERNSNSERSVWRDDDDTTITLTAAATAEGLNTFDVGALRTRCRQLAESQRAGLVEAGAVQSRLGLAAQLIYKTLEKPAFTFTGVQIIPLAQASLTWSVVARDKGTTGVREAAVTSALMNQGQLTLETYEQYWASDPYDPLYRGVDQSTLRYMSDDPSYDTQFPNHPLSKVRRLLRELIRRPDLGMVAPNPPVQPTGAAG